MPKDEIVWNYSHYMFLEKCDNPRFQGVWKELSQLPLGTAIYPMRGITCSMSGEDPMFSLAQGERLIVRRIMANDLAVERPERPDWAGRLYGLCPCVLYFTRCQPEYARN